MSTPHNVLYWSELYLSICFGAQLQFDQKFIYLRIMLNDSCENKKVI